MKKENDNEYVYKGNCPDKSLGDFIRMSPKKTYWKVDVSNSLQSTEPISGNISFSFLRMYKGWKN